MKIRKENRTICKWKSDTFVSTPKNIKFIKDPSVLTFKRAVIAKIQNSKSKRSVDIKKDETLTAGIDKKQTEQTTELFFEKFNPKQSL